MTNCKFCNGDIVSDSIYCPFCGKNQTDTFVCGKCESELVPNSKYCGECGASHLKTAVNNNYLHIVRNCLFFIISLFPNLHSIEACGRLEFWKKSVFAILFFIMATTFGNIIGFEITMGVVGWDNAGDVFPYVSLSINLLSCYILVRMSGHIWWGRVIDAGLDTNVKFNSFTLVLIALALATSFSPRGGQLLVLVNIGLSIVIFMTTIFVGVKKSKKEN